MTTAQPTEREANVGRVITPAIVENLYDVQRARKGVISPGQIRRIEIADALVETGASILALPLSMVQTLGLDPIEQRTSRTASGTRRVNVYSEVQITIQGRSTSGRVLELPDGCPVLIGQLPLEDLDLVIFPKEGKLIPNPAHGGEWIVEMY